MANPHPGTSATARILIAAPANENADASVSDRSPVSLEAFLTGGGEPMVTRSGAGWLNQSRADTLAVAGHDDREAATA